VLHAAIASGAIHNVGETYTDGWSADLALAEVEGMISGHTVDAVVAENDSTASGAIIALEDHHRTAAVSGQDGDPAALNQVALGTQTVDVWKDSRLLGSAAGEAAVELCGGTAVDRIRGTSAYTTPSGHSVSSLLIKPVPVTRDNLQSVIDAGWITRDDLCTDVKTGSVAACP
jgi:D-xylose transport system substrate-binding protein